jgi:hypothetical protein
MNRAADRKVRAPLADKNVGVTGFIEPTQPVPHEEQKNGGRLAAA